MQYVIKHEKLEESATLISQDQTGPQISLGFVGKIYTESQSQSKAKESQNYGSY